MLLVPAAALLGSPRGELGKPCLVALDRQILQRPDSDDQPVALTPFHEAGAEPAVSAVNRNDVASRQVVGRVDVPPPLEGVGRSQQLPFGTTAWRVS